MTRSSTPLMEQYREIKDRHQDAILFFRMGDFYEMFYEDAEVASKALGLTLTSRNNGGAAEVPLAGVPVKAAGEYLRRLVQQGYRVSICEQTEDPKLAKGIVKRAVVETVTPGAVFSDDLLDSSRNNYLCAIHEESGTFGIAAADVSTGEFRVTRCTAGELRAVLARIAPREILTAESRTLPVSVQHTKEEGALVTGRPAWEFDARLGESELARTFRVASAEGLGFSPDDDALLSAAAALLRYLGELQPGGVPHLSRPVIEKAGDVMPLDDMTRRNLELVESLRGEAAGGTLLAVLDHTQTPMGSRLLRDWLLAPLRDVSAIEDRLDAVASLVSNPVTRATMREVLKHVRDIERLCGKAACDRATPREVGSLGASLARLQELEAVVRALAGDADNAEGNRLLSGMVHDWDSCADVAAEVSRALVDRPPATVGEEPCIRAGFDTQLDEWRSLRDGGKDAIARIQLEERTRTGISSLKVGYNRVFGYFIEVTNSNAHLIPSDYQRRQTLTGAERFVTPALKEYEERVLSAAERVEQRERELVGDLRRRIAAHTVRMQRAAKIVAQLDVLASLAEAADRGSYVRPAVTTDFALSIRAGRHPVVERMMPREKFIPNDTTLTEDARVIILTGPNMAGKSTILRQIGLIVLLAHVGSFVPAAQATIGVVDRLFTRVGASDNLVRGQSTFMVEMTETSAILHTASARGLVLLDEIGRGTSTYDGVSIAWAVSEYLHDRIGCKTVFATHYHELTHLPQLLVACRNYSVEVREAGGEVLFLHRLVEGGADRSYGIDVGRLAGLPDVVVRRARGLLHTLEQRTAGGRGADAMGGNRGAGIDHQLALFGVAQHPVVDELKELNPESMTPIEAITLLDRLVTRVRQG